jgi:hypothetical protein
VGTTICRRFQAESSKRLRTGGAGSRHSGIKTIKDSGSVESDKRRSKCVTIVSISSSQNGGLASNDPEAGLKSNTGLWRQIKFVIPESAMSKSIGISPSGTKVSVGIRKSGAKLAEVAVQRRSKTFKRDAKVFVKAFEHGQR